MMASAWKIPAIRITTNNTMITTAVAGRTTRAYTCRKTTKPPGQGGFV